MFVRAFRGTPQVDQATVSEEKVDQATVSEETCAAAGLTEDVSTCQDRHVNELGAKLSRALDWAGLIPAGLVLAIGAREYCDGASVGWPIAGALLVLISVWAVYRGMRRRSTVASR